MCAARFKVQFTSEKLRIRNSTILIATRGKSNLKYLAAIIIEYNFTFIVCIALAQTKRNSFHSINFY